MGRGDVTPEKGRSSEEGNGYQTCLAPDFRPGQAWDGQRPSGARKKPWKVHLPSCHKERTPLVGLVQNSGLQNCEKICFCNFQHAGVVIYCDSPWKLIYMGWHLLVVSFHGARSHFPNNRLCHFGVHAVYCKQSFAKILDCVTLKRVVAISF